ncbi:hypothetical protein H6P81_013300 [Aristolochia fimbriata]|uniref:non-specific serine/threonine protein kinase n=1 Tax=Aristolochia fimbriata TaxID=158543 RepID=A0AAV7EEB6_ARIFI|nr:hypothetical protein H6P81_013300 [Aristolochia fimbriata]
MEEDRRNPLVLDLRDLRVVSVLGRGAKGVAFLVRYGSETLALKAICRKSIEKKQSQSQSQSQSEPEREPQTQQEDAYRRVWFERDVLDTFHHPLLPKLRGTLVTDKIVGFALQLCSGGDLNSLRKKQTEKMFSDDITRFYAAELVLALEYLHGLGIVYRDLKPENVLVQDNGHIMLVDFDLSARISTKSTPNSSQKFPSGRQLSVGKASSRKKRRIPSFLSCISAEISITPAESDSGGSCSTGPSKAESSWEKSNSFVGTEEYIAPEMIIGKGHDLAVDWWSLGVVLYEMLYGRTPFRGSNRKETFYRILTKTADLVGEPTPLRDLIGRLLEKDPEQRISVEGIKKHEFFRGVDWEDILNISRPPFVPMGKEVETEEVIPGIDMEEFVESVFGGGGGGGDEREKVKKMTEVDPSDKKDKHEFVWVNALSNSRKKDEFLIF